MQSEREQTFSEVLIRRSEVAGVAKVANNCNDLVKGSLTRQKLQNSKVYAKSPDFRQH